MQEAPSPLPTSAAPILVGEAPAPIVIPPPDDVATGPQATITIPILAYPDPRLRQPSYAITEITPDVIKLATTMAQGVLRLGGWGMAAPQLGYQLQLIVLNLTGNPENNIALINPEIIEMSPETCVMLEGCLSVPGIRANITRPARIKLHAKNLKGEEFENEFDGLAARVLQHELEHLLGILFVDHVKDPVKRRLIDKKLAKIKLASEKKARDEKKQRK